MPKKIPPHLRDKRAMSLLRLAWPHRDHVYPDLAKYTNQRQRQQVHTYEEHGDPYRPGPPVRKFKQRQGSVFSQAPYVVCGDCNNGWMNCFEDEMVKFAKPIFWESCFSYALSNSRDGRLAYPHCYFSSISRAWNQTNPWVSAAERDYSKK